MRSNTLIAGLVLQNGKPYVTHCTHQGDAESGPLCFTYYGYRWGRLSVELQPNGYVRLLWRAGIERWVNPFTGEKHAYQREADRVINGEVGAASIKAFLENFRSQELRKQFELAYSKAVTR